MEGEGEGGPVAAGSRVRDDWEQEVLTDEALYPMCRLRLPSSDASFAAAADLINSLISPQANAGNHLASCCIRNTTDRMEEEGTHMRIFNELTVRTHHQHLEWVRRGSDSYIQCAFCSGIATFQIYRGNILTGRIVHYHDCVFVQTAEHVKEVMAFMDRPEVGILLEMGYCKRRVMKLISRRLMTEEGCLSTRTLMKILQDETSAQDIQ